MCYWKQWKKISTKHDNLIRLGLNKSKAWEYANTRKGYWRVSNSPILSRTLTNEFLKKSGFCTVTERYALLYIKPIEPPYAERHVRWCERTACEIIVRLLLDLSRKVYELRRKIYELRRKIYELHAALIYGTSIYILALRSLHCTWLSAVSEK